ncbi:molybdopterin-guanine dinucleotide biosynthesis protein MobC [Providencia sp. PROV033]|uniref:molybdopterin-guanine dinucleotide biosynthesis protein MobC n=1 Tax=Providencia sp. PROV033 TaxID=2949765 RepID=UPI00234A4D5E|nr:molybdopterin-guanine dinucleotide biosynthesis protein MobC [Providencia sp. PROV033]
MAEKKYYSMEDIEQAKSSLNELPDLTLSRLTKTDALERLKETIVELANKKGYSVEEIRSALMSVGITASVKAIRDMLSSPKKSQHRTTKNKKSESEVTKN